jgi:hypothetical protein
VKGKDNLLKGAGMGIPQKVVDEPGIFPIALCSPAIRNPGGLNHPLVASKIIHETDKSFVQNLKLPVQNSFGFRHDAMSHNSPSRILMISELEPY